MGGAAVHRRGAVQRLREGPHPRRRTHSDRLRPDAAGAHDHRPGVRPAARQPHSAPHPFLPRQRARAAAGGARRRGDDLARPFEPGHGAVRHVAGERWRDRRQARGRAHSRRQPRRRHRALCGPYRLGRRRPPRGARKPHSQGRLRGAGAALRRPAGRDDSQALAGAGSLGRQLPLGLQSRPGFGGVAAARAAGTTRHAPAAGAPLERGRAPHTASPRPERARHALRGARVCHARDAGHGRYRSRHAEAGAGGDRGQRHEGRQGCREGRQRRRRAARGHQALSDPGLQGRHGPGGQPALRGGPHLHDQPRAHRRYHRQEPDGACRQEDQEALCVLARRLGRVAHLPRPRGRSHAAGAQRVRDP